MTQLFANNAYGSLASQASASSTSLTLLSGQGARFPSPTGGDFFLLTLVSLDSNGNENGWEIVKVTARATDGLTVVRAQEGTTAAIWPVGTRIELRDTAGTLTSLTDAIEAAAAAPVQSVAGKTGAVTLVKGDVGLGNVDNKSSATIRSELTSGNVTTALGFTPENAANKGAANGYVPLGSDSKIPSTYMPAYVDDVLEYANLAALPATGLTGIIYVTLDTNKVYRWGGSSYTEISPSPGSTDSVTEGSVNLYFTNARAIAAVAGTYLALAGGTVTGPAVVSVNSSSDALRITQLGTGNAILVEDSASPDATPFVVDASGQVGIGTASPSSNLQVTSDSTSTTRLQRNSTDASSAGLFFVKQRGTLASPTVVSSSDSFGSTRYYGNDGTTIIEGARIEAAVDGTPGTNDMPGRLVFSTTADGASSPTERMRIDNAGRVGIGSSTLTGYNLRIGKALTGGVDSVSLMNSFQINSDVTSSATGYQTQLSTQATAFTTSSVYHYLANNLTIGAGSSVSNQYGFVAESSLTAATNNYGFRGNIAAGTGRYNFYAAGTAANYFGGNVGIGTTAPSAALDIGSTASSGTFASQIFSANNNAAAKTNYVKIDALVAFNPAGSESGGYKLQVLQNNAYKTIIEANGALVNASNYLAFGTTNEAIRIVSNGTTSIGGTPGAESLRVTPVASAVNYLNVYGATTGNQVNMRTEGSDTNIGFNMTTKGFAGYTFYTAGYGGTQFSISHTASAVNYLQVTGDSGAFPRLSAQGSSTNVAMVYITKGTEAHIFQTNGGTNQFIIANAASAVNYLQVTGAVTGRYPNIQAQGSDANTGFDLVTKGTAPFRFFTNNYVTTQLRVVHTASAVNLIDITGGATGNAPSIAAVGSDTNIDIALTTKGTGNVRFGTLTANADAAITGYITIKDSAGDLRKLAVIA